MPALSPKQQKYFGTELQRRRQGQKPRVKGMSTAEVERMATKPKGGYKKGRGK